MTVLKLRNAARRALVLRRRVSQAVVAASLLLVVQMLCASPVLSTNAVTIGGPFALTAPDGSTVTDRTYRGKWLLVYFGYTSCPDLCPTTLLTIAETLKALGPDAAQTQPLFITLDPQRDTPAIMGEYVQSFDPRIVGLSGSLAEIDVVAQAYGAYVARHEPEAIGGNYTVDHSNAIYLMDTDGVFVRAFDSDWSGETIALRLREIMARHRDGASADR